MNPPRILIVDDEPGIRQSLSGVLADEGFEALAVESGEECLDALAAAIHEIVLLDIWLPGIDALHALSPRAANPFVEVNCAAIPEDLIESELFGHMKGSFTAAHERKVGKFQKADGGTLFLDEVGDMSLKTQAKVLRSLEEQRFEPVGAQESIRVDVRVVAATNKNLEEEIEKGNFREDLFYRLNVIPFHVPSLRDRKSVV